MEVTLSQLQSSFVFECKWVSDPSWEKILAGNSGLSGLSMGDKGPGVGVEWGRGKGKEASESSVLSFLHTLAQRQQTAYSLPSVDLDKGFSDEEENGFTCVLFLLDLFLMEAVCLSRCTLLKATFLALSFRSLYHRGWAASCYPHTKHVSKGLGSPQRTMEHAKSCHRELTKVGKRKVITYWVPTVYTALPGISCVGDLKGSTFFLDSHGNLRIYRWSQKVNTPSPGSITWGVVISVLWQLVMHLRERSDCQVMNAMNSFIQSLQQIFII